MQSVPDTTLGHADRTGRRAWETGTQCERFGAAHLRGAGQSLRLRLTPFGSSAGSPGALDMRQAIVNQLPRRYRGRLSRGNANGDSGLRNRCSRGQQGSPAQRPWPTAGRVSLRVRAIPLLRVRTPGPERRKRRTLLRERAGRKGEILGGSRARKVFVAGRPEPWSGRIIPWRCSPHVPRAALSD